MARGLIHRPAGGGELIGDSEDRRVELLSDRDELHATWTRFGPHREGADLHVHQAHSDLFYVLEGELTVALGVEGRTKVVPAGSLARVPPLVVHGFRNAADAEVRYLNFHAPGGGFADYMRALRDGRPASFDSEDPPEDGGRSPDEASIGRGEVVVEEPGLRVTALAGVDAISISEIRSAPGGPSPAPHLGKRRVESFYVLAGGLAFTVGDRELRARAGAWMQVPPGGSHSFAPFGPDEALFLIIQT